MRYATLLLLTLPFCAQAQNVGINATGAAPAPSAMLDVASTTAGMLVPRMTAEQRTAIAAPATGLLVYQTDDATGFWYYTGTTWVRIGQAVSAFHVFSTEGIFLTANGIFYAVPGMSQVVTVDVPSRAYVQVDGGVQTNAGTPSGYSIADVAILLNGALPPNCGYKRVSAMNNGSLVTAIENMSMGVVLDLAPGTHTISVVAAKNGGVNATIFGDSTSVLQGSMSIIVVPQ